MPFPLWGSPPEHLGTSVQYMDYGQNLSGSGNMWSYTPAVVHRFPPAGQGGRLV